MSFKLGMWLETNYTNFHQLWSMLLFRLACKWLMASNHVAFVGHVRT